MAETKPHRVQLSRKRGWRKPENTVVVARPSKWGNPFRIVHTSCMLGGLCWQVKHEDRGALRTWRDHLDTKTDAAREAVAAYRRTILAEPQPGRPGVPTVDEIRSELAGKNLGCWCPLTQPCHVDVLLEIANADG